MRVRNVKAADIDNDNLMPPSIVKTYLRLIKGAKKWAETRGSEMVLVSVTTGMKLRETDQLLRLAGAKCVGGGYVV